jgi:DNA-binding winged helix-turn-helix (wHTH) protein
MDKVAQAYISPSRIDLAREADFTIGPLQVRPSRREVEGGGERQVLQPRVMQVLVALAQSTNAVVSQHELVVRCWDGLSVSDDAIGRCIAQLRKLAATWPQPPFEIETIAGVGYRLEPASWTGGGAGRPLRGRQTVLGGPRAIVAAVAVLGLGLALAGWMAVRWLDRSPRLATPLVEVRALSVIGDDPALHAYAARATDAVAAFLDDSDVRVVSTPSASPGHPPKVQLTFGGVVSGADGQMRLHLTLNDVRSDTVLWSGDYAEPAARADALIEEAKGGAIESINLIRPAYAENGLVLDPETNLLFVRDGEVTNMWTFASRTEAVHDIEQALSRDPSSGLLHATYAADLASAGDLATPSERTDLYKRARAEALRAIREHHDQSSGLAYAALVYASTRLSPRDLVGNLGRLETALKAAPEDPTLYDLACQAMIEVGRAVDALHYCERALALRPHTAWLLRDYSFAMDLHGNRVVADHLLEEAKGLYPYLPTVRGLRWQRETFVGSPDKALALLDDPVTAPLGPAPTLAAFRLLEIARKSGRASDADAAMAALRDASQHYRLSAWRVAFPMVLGRLDEAFHSPDLIWFETDGVSVLMGPTKSRCVTIRASGL